MKKQLSFCHKLLAVILVPVTMSVSMPQFAFAEDTTRRNQPPASPDAEIASSPSVAPPQATLLAPPAVSRQEDKKSVTLKRKEEVTLQKTSSRPSIPGNPDVAFFEQTRILPEILTPCGSSPTAADNTALANALRQMSADQPRRNLEVLEDFIHKHPDSPWIPAVQGNLAKLQYQSGYFTRALNSWSTAWDSVQGVELSERALRLMQDCYAELVRMHARLGHVDKVEELLSSVNLGDFQGAAAQVLQQTELAVANMHEQPDISFRCGPHALTTLFKIYNAGEPIPLSFQSYPSTKEGVTLSELIVLGDAATMGLVAVKRPKGGTIPVPSLVHWSLDHYAAITDQRDGFYLLTDPTFGESLWITAEAIEEESSGYFMVKAEEKPESWDVVEPAEAVEVSGRGYTNQDDDKDFGPDELCTDDCFKTKEKDEASPPGSGKPGMPVYSVNAMLVSLIIRDTPLVYSPADGPDTNVSVFYNQKDSYQPANFYYSHMGPQWTYGWLSYLEVNPTVTGADVGIYNPGGGFATVSGYNSGTASYAPEFKSGAVLKVIATDHYEYEFPDGSKRIYSVSDGAITSPQRIFLTQVVDASGNAVTLTYDTSLRITELIDATGLVTTFEYSHPTDSFKITRIIDPFGRFATFTYDDFGRLETITDVLGLTSQFTYAANMIVTMTTPYGTTTFSYGQLGRKKWMEVTDPYGDVERTEFNMEVNPGPFSATPEGVTVNTNYLQYRNTFYWDKEAMHYAPNDYSKAKVYHWLHDSTGSTTSSTLEYVKQPLEQPIWYGYSGQSLSVYEGDDNNPRKIGRVLDDSTTQLFTLDYNSIGKTTYTKDPAGRETQFVYASNAQDLLQVQQKNSGVWETLSTFTYNSYHQVLTATDAAGETTTYTYNANQQLETVTNALGHTTTYSYYSADETDMGGAVLRQRKDRLEQIDGPLAGTDDVTFFDYDAYGRLNSVTDSEGYTVTMAHDDLNRITSTTFPDSTYTQVVYDRLHPEWMRDRLGRWTRSFYNKLQQPVATQDPAGRITQFEWCRCGDLRKLIDPEQNITWWKRDIQGRVIEKVYSDQKSESYEYANHTSRLVASTDAKGQVANYEYFVDGNLKRLYYEDDLGNPITNTPEVSYTYEIAYNRLATRTDGIGTTSYAYYPVNAADSVLGDGALHTIDGPWTDDTITYEYDELGRVINRQINGTANESSAVFDSLGRVTSLTNNLGTFSYAYVNETGRVDYVDLPNGQRSNYDYYNNAGDQRLKEIEHLAPGLTSTISSHQYVYNAQGQITEWLQDHSGLTDPQRYALGYDGADQLVSAELKNDVTSAILKRFSWGYDKAGNRVSEQIDEGPSTDADVRSATANNLNQLIAKAAGGPTVFRGTLDEPGTVTIDGQPATMKDGGEAFEGWADLAIGTNTVTIEATDENSNVTTNQFELTVASGDTKTLLYDDNGNLVEVKNGGVTERTYEWDARDRLLAVNYTATSERSEFVYDGLDRRVKVIEKDGSSTVTSEKAYLWSGTQISEERDATGSTVAKRFYSQGVEVGSTDYYYLTDHLGSIREATDSTGTVQARYDYSLWGERTKVSGTLDLDFGFTGHYYHDPSQLHLALYRAYDAKVGRWISRDVLADAELGIDGPNIYAYVNNEPVGFVDPLGLESRGNQRQEDFRNWSNDDIKERHREFSGRRLSPEEKKEKKKLEREMKARGLRHSRNFCETSDWLPTSTPFVELPGGWVPWVVGGVIIGGVIIVASIGAAPVIIGATAVILTGSILIHSINNPMTY